MADGLTVQIDAPALAVLERRLVGFSARAVKSLRAEASKAMALTKRVAFQQFTGNVKSDVYGEGGNLRPHTRTARLKQSIRMLESSPRPRVGGGTEYEWSVGTNVRYARPVELGGRTQLGRGRSVATAAQMRSRLRARAKQGPGRAFSRPHPYLTPGFAAGTARFTMRAREIIERELAAGGAGTVS